MPGGRKPHPRLALFIQPDDVPEPSGPLIHRKLNELLAKHQFDERAEALCASYYSRNGRPSTPVGAVVRMLVFAFLGGIGSQCRIAVRCADSLSPRCSRAAKSQRRRLTQHDQAHAAASAPGDPPPAVRTCLLAEPHAPAIFSLCGCISLQSSVTETIEPHQWSCGVCS